MAKGPGGRPSRRRSRQERWRNEPEEDDRETVGYRKDKSL
jgi:hypothetical protein